MRFVLVLTCWVSSFFIVFAQNSITGSVVDADSGEALVGVTVAPSNGPGGTTTDTDGSYRLPVGDGATALIFRYLGYTERTVPIDGRRIIDVRLEPAATQLNELVVTALGLERDTRDLGYALQRVEGATLTAVQAPNFVDNLAGRVAGLTVNRGATGVGSSTTLSIRGEASFTNNNPLFVVDGTPINNRSILNVTNEAAAGFQEVDFGNGAMDIDPHDIATVTVLKGPSAAALYGTRASNGVILITTKDGSDGQGRGIRFSSATYVDRAFRLPQFQNRYGQGNSGEFAFVDGLGGGTNDNITYSWGPELNVGTLLPQFDSPATAPDGRQVRGGDVAVHGGAPITPTAFVSYEDNLRDFYETGLTTVNNLSLGNSFNGGSYRFSAGDLRSESIIPGVDFERNNASARLVFTPEERLRVTANVNYVNSRSNNRPSGGYGSENINYSLVAWGPRSLDTEILRDYWQPGLEGVQQYSFNYTFFDNPYFILLENRNSFNRDRLFGNIAATYEFGPRLQLTLRTGMDYSTERREFRRAFSTNRFRNGAYAEHDVDYRERNSDFLLDYRAVERGDWQVGLSFGGNRLDQVARNAQTQALSLAQPGVYSLSNAASPLETFQFESTRRINSLYGIARVAYRNFLFVDITGRNDWSSALATPVSAANTGFFYPSVSTGLVLSALVDMPEKVSFAKLRANWAQVGNDTDPFQTTGAFVAQTPYLGQPTFSAQASIANADLLPEQTTAVELGADVRFFDDQLRLDVTYYNARTENQIIRLPVAISSGFASQVVNGGVVRSRGVEAILGATPLRNDRLRWDVQLNFSRNVATVEDLPQDDGRLTLAYSRVYDNTNQTVWFQVAEGGRIGDMYGTGYLRNDDGDFVINEDGRFIVDNRLQLLGNYNPDFILGINNSLSVGQWTVRALLDWRQGGELVSRTQSLAGVGGQLLETADRPAEGIVADGVVNTGSPENPVYTPNTTAVTAEQFYRQFYDRNHEENNTFDASFLKLREVAVGYTFAAGTTGPLQDLRVSLVGRNLFAISDLPHFDPEQIAVQGNRFVRGVEDMSYATTRSFGLRLTGGF